MIPTLLNPRTYLPTLLPTLHDGIQCLWSIWTPPGWGSPLVRFFFSHPGLSQSFIHIGLLRNIQMSVPG